MIIALIGSRSFNNYEYMVNSLKPFGITMIVSGGANRGADKLAEVYAHDFDIPIKIFYADWRTYGKRAGMIRNQYIVDACENVFAFWDGKSRGTKDAMDKAAEAKKATYVFTDWEPLPEFSWGLDNPMFKRISKIPPLIIKP